MSTSLDAQHISDETAARLQQTGACLQGHFLLSSGLHSSQYIQCARLLSHPPHAEFVGRSLATLWRQRGLPAVDVVLGPALGGIVVAHEVARAFGVRALFAEREAGTLTLRRGFTLEPTERVLVVEDVITTGGSALETAALATLATAQVVGFAAVVERGRDSRLQPLLSLWQTRPQVYSEKECPLCQAGSPVVKPGSRTTAAYPTGVAGQGGA